MPAPAPIVQWAETFRDSLLEGCAAEAVIAGSVRRGKPDPHDLEIVIRLHEPPALLLSEMAPPAAETELDAWIQMWTRIGGTGAFQWDQTVKRNGPRYKRFVMTEITGCGGVPFELFIADRRNMGNTVAIRTGDADFTKLMVTPRRKGGLLPDHMAQMGGYLYSFASFEGAQAAREAKRPDGGELVECPTEESWFMALNLPVPPMDQRNETGGHEMRRHLGRRAA